MNRLRTKRSTKWSPKWPLRCSIANLSEQCSHQVYLGKRALIYQQSKARHTGSRLVRKKLALSNLMLFFFHETSQPIFCSDRVTLRAAPKYETLSCTLEKLERGYFGSPSMRQWLKYPDSTSHRYAVRNVANRISQFWPYQLAFKAKSLTEELRSSNSPLEVLVLQLLRIATSPCSRS